MDARRASTVVHVVYTWIYKTAWTCFALKPLEQRGGNDATGTHA